MFNIKQLNIISLTGLLFVAGCQSNLERHDGVTSYAGNSNAVNEAKMVVDPWNPNSENTDIHTDGRRAADAIDRYRNANAGEAEKIGSASKTTN